MEKKEIDRGDLKDNIMKHIIFRFDYQGMIDSTAFVKELENFLETNFSEYSKNVQNTVDFKLNNVEDISNTLSIPVSEIKKQDIHVFNKNTFGTDKVTLYISVYNTILNIECQNYQNIDPYIEFINKYIELLLSVNKFISLKRFGLRKIGSNIYLKFEDIHKDFEKQYFNFNEKLGNEFSLLKNRIEEVLNNEQKQVKINFIRNLETGTYYDSKNNSESTAYQVTLDFDAYLDEEGLIYNDYKKNFKSLNAEINNNFLFNLFKSSVTERFLNNNLKK